MEYDIGDIINLRNDAGIFQVELSRKAENRHRWLDNGLYFNDTMRLECYNHNKEYIVTMRGHDDAANGWKRGVMIIDTLRNAVEYFVGYVRRYDKNEKEDVFELMK